MNVYYLDVNQLEEEENQYRFRNFHKHTDG